MAGCPVTVVQPRGVVGAVEQLAFGGNAGHGALSLPLFQTAERASNLDRAGRVNDLADGDFGAGWNLKPLRTVVVRRVREIRPKRESST
jgi:hypothetical protein